MAHSKELLRKLYFTMKRIRVCEESLIEPITKRKILCPVHLYSGEEAIATGVCAALKKEDYIFGNHRSHGHYLAKGGDMSKMVAEIYCKESGCSHGRGGSMHLIDPENGIMGVAPIVAGTIPLAVGAALASTIKKEKRIVISFFGDGASGEGGLYEALNFASLKKLPIIFICENNQYSTHLPLDEIRVNIKISEIAKPFSIENYTADGNDVLEVYDLAKKAVKKCRNGEGPVFIEFITFRFRGHVGPNDIIQGTHKDIRPKELIELWKLKDPLLRFKNYLFDNKILTESEISKIDQLCLDEVSAANNFAVDSDTPDIKELGKYVFKE
jgi:acetoin:2,6-dichlorophenolindophenol oxidoreductase subunit alpha